MAASLKSKILNILLDFATDLLPEDQITTNDENLHTIVRLDEPIDLDLLSEMLADKLKRIK